ncbi:Leucine-rich repeat-containing protein 27 [Geodia barretti]|uniref:Leucine-rich repeat-containing protein 27 n=1 Tax=Geodia barretti TaxID=519541 RepID=A0AA35RTG7_GEOBA|nr:Leucine-rich repeat-containing protein 27 [Geodia barretti]
MECALDVSSASALALPCLDLSKRDMSELPEMEGCEHLRCLYLEGNRLSQLPPSLFSSCPHLQWLDLRNNRLTHLPQFIQRFRDLKTLLLQGNRLTALPTQLGEHIPASVLIWKQTL